MSGCQPKIIRAGLGVLGYILLNIPNSEAFHVVTSNV